MVERMLADRLADGFTWWLAEEIKDSHEGRNKVLDDFVKTREDYLEAASSSANRDMLKSNGHFSRFRMQLSSMDDERLMDDRYVGRIMHHALMFVSGGYRTECFLRAGDQTEYETLRFSGYSRLDTAVRTGVAKAIGYSVGLAVHPQLFADRLAEYNQTANEQILEAHRGINRWFRASPEVVQHALDDEDAPVAAAQEWQRQGLKIATLTALAVSALKDADVSGVPILEPKSITDAAPEPIYPIPA